VCGPAFCIAAAVEELRPPRRSDYRYRSPDSIRPTPRLHSPHGRSAAQ
jgi:hypothetical protein